MFFLLLFVALCPLCFSQEIKRQTVDSLLNTLQTAKPNANQLNTLNRLGHYFLTYGIKQSPASLDTAMFFFNKELDLSKRLRVDNGNGTLESLCCMADTYLAKNEFKQAKAFFLQVASHYEKAGDKKMQGRTFLRFGEAVKAASWLQPPKDLIAEITGIYENAARLFISAGDNEDEIIAYTDLAALHQQYYLFDLVEADCMRALKKYRGRYDVQMMHIYFKLSYIERYRGNYNKALRYTLEDIALVDRLKNNDTKTLARSWLYGELGLCYDALNETENSIIWYKKTLALRENMPIKLEFKYRTAGFIVQGLIKEKKYSEAFGTALGIEKRHPPDNDYNRAIISQIKAYCYDAVGNYKKAEELFLLALKLFGDKKGDEIVSLAKYDVAKFYIKQKEYKKAAFYLDEKLEKGMSITMSRDWHLIFYKIDSADGNYASALQHHILYKVFNDSIFNSDKNKQIQELQIKYETAKKEQDIQYLKKDSQFQRENVVHANNTRNLTLACSALLIVLTLWFYSDYRTKKRSNITLNALVNEKDKLLKEKEWLIKEIHHRVKNNLQIVMGLLQRQSAYIDNEAALQAIQNSESRMHSIALIHQKLYQSENLDLINMAEYINELVSYLKESMDTGNRLRFEKDIEHIDLGVSQAVPLGLILNEAITNAIKYAYPDNERGVIKVMLKCMQKTQMELIVEDYGKGIPQDISSGQSNSLGMNLMKGLSKQIGGTFELEHHNGVTIRISFHAERITRQETIMSIA